jgi:hypothetical protein
MLVLAFAMMTVGHLQLADFDLGNRANANCIG